MSLLLPRIPIPLPLLPFIVDATDPPPLQKSNKLPFLPRSLRNASLLTAPFAPTELKNTSKPSSAKRTSSSDKPSTNHLPRFNASLTSHSTSTNTSNQPPRPYPPPPIFFPSQTPLSSQGSSPPLAT
ncbi:hypothetical protein JVU11DRAFT_9294 [Chiua virens]|nr:hypothetical protein JVU11DRAFT_9294 [Chiua virens]